MIEDRRFIACEGGPSVSRLVWGEPPLEIDDAGGIYVLDDTDPAALRYVWIAESA